MEGTLVGGRALEALGPLVAGLRAGNAAGVAPGLRAGTQDGWASVEDMPLEEMIQAAAERWSAPPHVAAALWWKGFSYWTALPVVMGWAMTRRVPVMTMETTAVLPLSEAPHMLIGLIEPQVAPGEGRIIRETLIEGLHAPVIERLNALTRAGRRGLWGSVAEAFVEPFDLLGMPGAAGAEELTAAVGGPIAGLIDMTSGRRRTCCLWVTLPGNDACPTCCVKEPAC
ncbi:(2Fe-2S)-binding protein [Spirillospora sp. NPDC047279]|uniref:(2Fe-2S)-binding protein n=1 Tax=Spirillospora sp. NPDC047279 TaxID=3155478 RepID=UPI0033CC8907